MSTFSGLNSAYSGLVAARRGLDVVGQNVANVNTPGYTRQRVTTSAAPALAQVGRFSSGVSVGQGVGVDGIARLGSLQLDTRVRSTAAVAGFTAVRANAFAALEQGLKEPGKNGLSASLQEFSAAWQGVVSKPGDNTSAAVVIDQAQELAVKLRTGYDDVAAQWNSLHADLQDMTSELNAAAGQVADLNAQIRSTLAAGGNANELLDQRSAAITTLSALSGATVRESRDGMVDVLVDGNALVSGDSARRLEVSGDRTMGAGTGPVVTWSHRGDGLDARAAVGGEMGGAVSMLASARAGGGLAAAAESYNAVARGLADSVNAVHRTGHTTEGTTGLAFFSYDPADPARSLAVVPKDASGIAAGAAGKGPLDTSVADAISKLDSADKLWASFVTSTGAATRTELQQANLASVAAVGAQDAQLANASVDLDEENVNLLAYQHAYQGAARVMTAIDEMLDTLINRTGIVGR